MEKEKREKKKKKKKAKKRKKKKKGRREGAAKGTASRQERDLPVECEERGSRRGGGAPDENRGSKERACPRALHTLYDL